MWRESRRCLRAGRGGRGGEDAGRMRGGRRGGGSGRRGRCLERVAGFCVRKFVYRMS